ncbi:MAG: TonB-dependent receptor [Methylohalobius sp.]|nr:TonB-dependent receptor [Methylohalobius sp.]
MIVFWGIVGSPWAQDEYGLLFAEAPEVVTASRYLEPGQVAPASMEVITSQDIRRFGWRTLAEAISSLAGFQMTYDRAYGHLTVRGVHLPGEFGSRLLVLIDGHRLNENLQDYAGLDSDFPIDLDDVARIEVVRGPASALYGSSAMLAVIQIITKRGADLEGVRLGAEAGSFGAYQGKLTGGLSRNSAEAYLSASLWRRDGRRVLRFPEFARVRELDSQDGRRLFGRLSFGRWTLLGAFMERQKELPNATTAVFGDAGTLFHDRRAYADLRGEGSIGAWQGNVRLFWDRYEFSDRLPQLDGIVNRDLWHNEQVGIELWSSRQFHAHKVLLGGEYRASYYERMDNFDRPGGAVWAKNAHSSHVFGFYAQDHWQFRTNWTLVAGLRLDHFTRTDDTPLSPRLGLIWEATPTTALKLLYGRAYRAPNVFEARYRCCQGTWIPLSGLKPEYIHTLEAVFEQRLFSHLDFRLSGFHLRLEDVIQPRTQAGITSFVNGIAVRSTGLEAVVTGRWSELSGALAYSFAHVEAGGGNPWPDGLAHLVKARLAVPVWEEKLTVATEAQWVGPRPTASGGQSGKYFKLNLSLLATPWPGVELGVSLYNLLDRPYRDPPNPPIIPVEIPQDGRTFQVRLRYQWP